MDIDHFKRVNDTFGHHVGDRVLREVADLIKSATRGSDFCCRSGGEELLLVLPGATMLAAAERAEEIRHRSEALPVAEKELTLTISCGVSTYPTHGRGADEILTRADEALYRSKHAGRNRVTTWERHPPLAGRAAAVRGSSPAREGARRGHR